MADIFKQLAAQVAENGQTEEANRLSNLSNVILEMARQQGTIFGLVDNKSRLFEADRQYLFDQSRSLDPSCSVSSSTCFPALQVADYWPSIYGVTYKQYLLDSARNPEVQAKTKQELITNGGLSEAEADARIKDSLSDSKISEYMNQYGLGAHLVSFYKELAFVMDSPYMANNPTLKGFVRDTARKVERMNQGVDGGVEWAHAAPHLEKNYIGENVKAYTDSVGNTAEKTRQGGENICYAGGGTRLINEQCPP